MKRIIPAMIVLSLLIGFCHGQVADQTHLLEKIVNLGLPKLVERIPTYHSNGAETRARRLASAIADMKTFYEKELGIRVDVTLAVLDSNNWTIVSPYPYGLPNIEGTPSVIVMPATSGGGCFSDDEGRIDAIPVDLLKDFLETNQTSFDVTADEFVDIIGFHELGHELCARYGIAPRCHWLNEYVASYFAYAFLSEQRPESKKVFDLLGRPSNTRPKHTTLADFERLYVGVDDYGWYQGMFERQIQELYPKMGLQFLRELRRRFPAGPGQPKALQVPNPVLPEEVLRELEAFAPGFEEWARDFAMASEKQ